MKRILFVLCLFFTVLQYGYCDETVFKKLKKEFKKKIYPKIPKRTIRTISSLPNATESIIFLI